MIRKILKMAGSLLAILFISMIIVGKTTHSFSYMWWAIPVSLVIIVVSAFYVAKRDPSTSRSNAQKTRRHFPHEDCSQ